MREDLLGYLMGALSPDEQQRVEDALAVDPDLRRELEPDALRSAVQFVLFESHTVQIDGFGADVCHFDPIGVVAVFVPQPILIGGKKLADNDIGSQ